jgi:hypothetical protein
METGLPEQALANFEKSSTIVPKGRTQPVLADAPAEWADLQRRKGLLLASLEVPTPVIVAAAPAPTPTSTPFAVHLPERPGASPPAEVLAEVPTPRPAPISGPPGVPLPATALALRGDLVALLADPVVSLRAGDALRPLLARLDAALARGAAMAATAERSLRRELSGNAGAPVLRAALEAGLEAHRERRYEEAARLARAAGHLVPGAGQPDLLRTVALATLWVLSGETRADLEAEARSAYAAWRSRRAAGTPAPRFLSPALRERLERPSPVPSRG